MYRRKKKITKMTIFIGIVTILVLLEPWKLISADDPRGQKNRYKMKLIYSGFALKVYKAMAYLEMRRRGLSNQL